MNPLLIAKGLELLDSVSHRSSDEEKHEYVKSVLSGIDDDRSFWARKTFWATVCAVAVPIVNRVAGLDMQIEEVTAAVTPLVAFILGESWRKKTS